MVRCVHWCVCISPCGKVCPLSEDKLREMEMEQASTIVYGENEVHRGEQVGVWPGYVTASTCFRCQ